MLTACLYDPIGKVFRLQMDLHACLAYCLNRFSIMEGLVGAFNKEKALAGAFSRHCEIFAKVSLQL